MRNFTQATLILAAILASTASPAFAKPAKEPGKQAPAAQAPPTEEMAEKFIQLNKDVKGDCSEKLTDLVGVESRGKAILNIAEQFKSTFNYGNAIHHGNIALGRVALARGDTKAASAYLLKAAATPGSPQLDNFGPNMMLAKELLAKGQQPAVLQYMQACLKWWKSPRAKSTVAGWEKSIKAKKMPKFLGHLYY